MCLSQIDVCAQVLGLTELHSKRIRRSLCVGTVMSCIGCIFTGVVASIVSTVSHYHHSARVPSSH